MTKEELYKKYFEKKEETQKLKEKIEEIERQEALQKLNFYKGKTFKKKYKNPFLDDEGSILIVIDVFNINSLDVIEILLNKTKNDFMIHRTFYSLEDDTYNLIEIKKEEVEEVLNDILYEIKSKIL